MIKSNVQIFLRADEKALDAYVKEGRRNDVFATYGLAYTLDRDNHIILE